MLGRILYVFCTYGVIAFGCAFVGAAVGIGASRAFRGERGASWLLVLLGLAASGLFLMTVFMAYYGAFDGPLLTNGLRIVSVVVLLGVACATPSVVANDHAAEGIVAGAVGAFLATIGTAILLTLSMGPGGGRVLPYAGGTFLPALIGAAFGWGLSWRRDLDELLDREIGRDAPWPAG
jgi:hypothetical protein